MSALTTYSGGALAEPMEFGAEEVSIIKNTICPGITDTELAYCLRVAGNLGANPILKEVHFLFQNYQDKDTKKWLRRVNVQVGIDFYRRKAMDTGRLQGRVIEWADPSGAWHEILPHNVPLYAARCSLYVQGLERPIQSIAYWSEFGEPAMEKNPIWKTKKRHMLAKVAEAHAIRVLCAGQLSGTVTEDEAEASDMITVSEAPKNTGRPTLAPPIPNGGAAPAEEGGKSPEQAKRDALGAIIKDFMKRLDGGDAEKVRKTISTMGAPGPIARTWPDWKNWTTEQLEELIGLYQEIESEPLPAEDDGLEEGVIEGEASEVQETPAEAAPESPAQKPEQESQNPETDLADELRPAATDRPGKPKAPF